jgi:hypothetical protein
VQSPRQGTVRIAGRRKERPGRAKGNGAGDRDGSINLEEIGDERTGFLHSFGFAYSVDLSSAYIRTYIHTSKTNNSTLHAHDAQLSHPTRSFPCRRTQPCRSSQEGNKKQHARTLARPLNILKRTKCLGPNDSPANDTPPRRIPVICTGSLLCARACHWPQPAMCQT